MEYDASEGASDYLDTQNLSSALNARSEQLKEALRVSRARGVPLRSRAVELLMLGEWEKWDEELAAHVADVRSYRRLMLSRRFTLATFRTLADAVWYGSEANPSNAFDADALHEHRAALLDYSKDHLDEMMEGAAIEDEGWLSDARLKDRAEWQSVANESEAEEWHKFENGYKQTPKGWEYDADATNIQKIARRQLHDRYEDTELIRAILFSQGRQKEWMEWITNPGSVMPDLTKADSQT
jgi:hypothetical protein